MSETRTVGAAAIGARVAQVKTRIAAAASRTGRAEADIALVAASKTVDLERILAAHTAGVQIFGENRVQEAADKIAQAPQLRWHFLGPLQRNKSRRAVELFELIHSLDSLRLAEALGRLGVERGRPVPVLVEVNLGGEATKAGVSPPEAPRLIEAAAALDGLAIRGLMTIPPPADDPERSRPAFSALRRLAAEIDARRWTGVAMEHLSMGMSDDFEVAIEEGATLVRVGSAIFGERG